jgi:hypothetical protein
MNRYLKGIIAAIIGGAVSSVAAYVADPAMIAGPDLGKRIGIVAVVGALTVLLAYFKQPPEAK